MPRPRERRNLLLRDGSILLLAEGAETALSTWTATGYETWASIGSIARHDPPAGRQIVVARDDDPQQSPADQALKRSMSTWLAGGVAVAIATPWPVRRHDRSDFDDTIRESGAALEPPHKPVSRMSAEEGRGILRTAIDEFYRQASDHNARVQAAKRAKTNKSKVGDVGPYPVHAIRADVGIGKSEVSMVNIADLVSAMRGARDKRIVVVAVRRSITRSVPSRSWAHLRPLSTSCSTRIVARRASSVTRRGAFIAGS
jgi:putative DNA primase/helicase